MENKKLPLLRRPLFHLALLVVAALLPYCLTFSYPFHLDDANSIVDNPVIRDLGAFLDGAGFRFNSRRFLGYLSFALNYRFGALDVTGYHLVNTAIHILCTVMVYLLARLVLLTPFFAEKTESAPSASLDRQARLAFIPLCAGLLFAVHPVQTQAVTYIVQRLASLATLFYLASLVLYLKGRLSRSVLPFIASALAALCALFTKEIAATLPFAILLVELSFFRQGRVVRRLLLAPFAAVAIFVPLVLLGARGPLGKFPSLLQVLQESSHVSRGDYLLTQFRVIVTYLRLLFLPVGQNADWEYPVYSSLQAPVFFSALLLLGLVAWAGRLYLKSGRAAASLPEREPLAFPPAAEPADSPQPAEEPRDREWAAEAVTADAEALHGDPAAQPDPPRAVPSRNLGPLSPEYRLIAFGILWFFLTLSVESSIVPIADVIFEHRLYLPTFGFFLAVAAGASLLAGRVRERHLWTGMAAVSLLLAVASFNRNLVWRDPVVLWSDVVAKSPDNERGYCNLGYALLQRGEHDAAIKNLLVALKLNPDYAKTHLVLGVALWEKRLLAPAQRSLELALQKDPRLWLAHFNLALLHGARGDVQRAIFHMENAAALNPADPSLQKRLEYLRSVRVTMRE